MSYLEKINALAADAEKLEQTYHEALRAGEAGAFSAAIEAGHASAPQNLLFAAWYYRLQYAAGRARSFAVAWAWVIPLAVANGLLFWWLSDFNRFIVTTQSTLGGRERTLLPAVVLLAAPVAGAFVLVYLTAVGRKRWRLSLPVGLALLAASAYVLWAYPQVGTRPFQEQYVTLMAMHLPLLAWAGVGAFLISEHRDPANRFAFLIKSLEVFIMGGLFVIAGGLFTIITVGLFAALDIEFSELAQRLFIAGGGGLIAVVATAVIYNPRVPPDAQAFDEGLSKLIALLMRILLPLALLVLLVYIAFVPFNFRAPFDNRDVLIIYNGMLFAVVALLVGATPLRRADLSPRLARWLRFGIVAVAALALLVSLYALTAIVYRTALDRLTPNRLTFMGWNVINIGLLALVLWRQARAAAGEWLTALQSAYSAGTVAYGLWTLAMILAVPWLFGIDQEAVGTLPVRVQELIFEAPDPLLLKCATSPHIYLLQDGEKRWIDTIETFNERGYVWSDVHLLTCADLRRVPSGESIPADAGPPPEP